MTINILIFLFMLMWVFGWMFLIAAVAAILYYVTRWLFRHFSEDCSDHPLECHCEMCSFRPDLKRSDVIEDRPSRPNPL